MTYDRVAYIGNFIQKLQTGEYIIDSKANEIQYDDMQTLAAALNYALEGYDYVTTHSLTTVYPYKINEAYNMITSVFSHGVLIDKNDLRTKLRHTEELLTHCDDDKARLEKDNNDLRRELIACKQIKETLEEQMLNQSQTYKERDEET
jgi:hypothetical protein